MRPLRISGIALLACLGLAGCNDNDERRSGMAAAGGKGICTPFPGQGDVRTAGGAAAMGPAPMDPSSTVDDCLHRWGYALAAASDPAGDVAQATVAACTTALARWNQQAMIPPAGSDARGPIDAPSLITGESTNPVSERYSFARTRALFYVVQARAGKCEAPPMSAGAPEGSARY